MVSISIPYLWRKKKDNILILHEDDELFFYPLTPMEDENGTAVFQSAISVTEVSKDPKIVGDFQPSNVNFNSSPYNYKF